MALVSYRFKCPACQKDVEIELVQTCVPSMIYAVCELCYYPLNLYPKRQEAEIRMEYQHKTAFLIHSSREEEKGLLDWFRMIVSLYGVSTRIIEEDQRVQLDWVRKSVDGIRQRIFTMLLSL